MIKNTTHTKSSRAIILTGFLSCEEGNSLTAPTSSEYLLEGLWQESFSGNPNPESVIISSDSGGYNIYEPDSISKTSQLKIEKDSFQVLLDGTYFLDGDTLLKNHKELTCTYEIVDDSIAFSDSFDNTEVYYYELGQKYLQLIYAPIIQSGNNLILIPSNIGLPCGKTTHKYRGKFTKID